MNYQYEYQYPEPEPEPYILDTSDPNPSCSVITIDPFNYLVMCLGAGIGYFLLGGYLSIFYCKKRTTNEEVILANPI